MGGVLLMADPIKIKIKRGLTAGVEPSGLTYGEVAINITDKKMFIGGPTGETILLFTSATGGTTESLAPGPAFAAGDSVAVVQPYSPTNTVPLIQDGALWFNTDTGMLYTGYVGPSGDAQWVQANTINSPENYS
jgi:hypothetical protein